MDYKKTYDLLILKGKTRIKIPQGERHHIVPKCMGGSNLSENLVYLSYREHLVAHLLLSKIYPNNEKLLYALFKLNNYHGKSKNSRSYEKIRSKFIKYQSLRMTKNNPMKGKKSPMRGKKHSTETIKKISDRTKDLFKDESYRKRHSTGVSKGVSGTKHPFYGKHHTNESLKKAAKTKGCKSFEVFLKGKFIGIWWSQSQCCRDLGLKSVGNLNICLKKGTCYKGYTFVYLP